MFADDTMLYMEKSKHSTKKLLEMINQFAKVADKKSKHTKMNSQKENQERNLIHNTHKKIKYLGISLAKVKDLYNEIY